MFVWLRTECTSDVSCKSWHKSSIESPAETEVHKAQSQEPEVLRGENNKDWSPANVYIIRTTATASADESRLSRSQTVGVMFELHSTGPLALLYFTLLYSTPLLAAFCRSVVRLLFMPRLAARPICILFPHICARARILTFTEMHE